MTVFLSTNHHQNSLNGNGSSNNQSAAVHYSAFRRNGNDSSSTAAQEEAIPVSALRPNDTDTNGIARAAAAAAAAAAAPGHSRASTPTIDFDDCWDEDPFSDTKESDVFAPFHPEILAAALPPPHPTLEDNAATAAPPPLPAVSGGVVDMSQEPQQQHYHHRKRNHAELEHSQGSRDNDNTDPESSETASTNTDGVIKQNASSSSSSIPFSRRKKKPKGMPKRPLSAYNLYFQAERSKILAKQEASGADCPKIGFEGLGKIIGKKWRDLSSVDKKVYEKLAETDSERYRKEMETYNELRMKRYEEEDRRASDSSLFPNSTNTNTTFIGHFSSTSGPAEGTMASYLGNASLSHFAGQSQTQDLSMPPPQPMVTSHPSVSPAQSPIINSKMTFIGQQTQPSPHHTSQGLPDAGRPSGGRTHQSPRLGSRSPSMHGATTPPPSSLHCSPQQQEQQRLQHQQEKYKLRQHANTVNGMDDTTSMFPGMPDISINNGNGGNNFPLPPGMEIVLSDSTGRDRKYRVQYTCYSMTREAAHEYLESLTGAKPHDSNNNAGGNNNHTQHNQEQYHSMMAANAPRSMGELPFTGHAQYPLQPQSQHHPHYGGMWGM